MGVVQRYAAGSRFFNRLGAANQTRSICSAAGQAGYSYTMGASMGADPETIPDSRLVVLWGVNAVSTNLHLMMLAEQARKKGAEIVVVDVHRNATARAADHFIQIYPGTDAALALGLMHVIVKEGLHDAEVRRSQHRRLRPAGSKAGGVSSGASRRRSPVYQPTASDGWRASTPPREPAFIALGNGPQHHEKGGMALRAMSVLPAIVGSWGKPGGGAFRSNGGYSSLNTKGLERPDLAPGPVRTVNMARLGSALLESEPPFRAIYVWSCNPAVIVPEQEKVVAGLSREDLFVVVHEQVMTDTARYADILLPNTTCFEQEDYFAPGWHLYASHSPAVIEPVGESKSDYEVFRLLAEAMGFEDPCFQESLDDIAAAGFDNPSNSYLSGVTAERLKREGLVRLNAPGTALCRVRRRPIPDAIGQDRALLGENEGRWARSASCLRTGGRGQGGRPAAQGKLPAPDDGRAQPPLPQLLLRGDTQHAEEGGAADAADSPRDAADRGITDGDAGTRVERPRLVPTAGEGRGYRPGGGGGEPGAVVVEASPRGWSQPPHLVPTRGHGRRRLLLLEPGAGGEGS